MPATKQVWVNAIIIIKTKHWSWGTWPAGAQQKLVAQNVGVLEFREGSALREAVLWKGWGAACSPGKVFCSHALSLRSTKHQTDREQPEKGTTHDAHRKGRYYRKCSSTAPFVFMTCGTADTTGNLIPQMQLCADCTYLKDYNFPIRTECFLPFPGKRSVPLCLVLQALRHVIVRCKSRCA